MLLELVRRDRGEALEQLRRRNLGVAVLAAGREEVGEQRLQDGEPLGCDGPRGALDGPDAELVFNTPAMVKHINALAEAIKDKSFDYGGRLNEAEGRFINGDDG